MRKAVPLTAILTAVTISLTSCALFSGRPTAGGEQDKEYRDSSSHTETPQGGTRMKYQGFIWGGLYVEDVERAILFYRDVLGLPLLRRSESSATFAFPNGALFGLFSGGIASSTAKTPEQQSLELGFRVNDLDAAIEELEAKGVQFVSEIGHWEKSRWIYFADPEGNTLEIAELVE